MLIRTSTGYEDVHHRRYEGPITGEGFRRHFSGFVPLRHSDAKRALIWGADPASPQYNKRQFPDPLLWPDAASAEVSPSAVTSSQPVRRRSAQSGRETVPNGQASRSAEPDATWSEIAASINAELGLVHVR
jgi:hypothetical protein